MKLRMLSLVLLLAMCMTIVPLTAFASESVAVTGTTTHHPGDSITISGGSDFSQVIIKVLRPGNSSVLYFDVAKVTAGQYSSTFTLGSSEPVGTYTVVAGQASTVATTTFAVTASGSGGTGGTGGGTDTGTIGGTGGGSVTGTITPPVSTKPGVVLVGLSKNVTSEVKAADGTVTTTVTQDAGTLAEAFKQLAAQPNSNNAPVAVIKIDNKEGSVKVNLPASALADASVTTPNALVSIETNSGSYSLPLSIFDFASLAKNLGVSINDLVIHIDISPVAPDLNALIQASAEKEGGNRSGDAVAFTITVGGTGNNVELNDFGATYVTRTILLPNAVDPNHTTGVLYDPGTGQISFVPSVFGAPNANGQVEANLMRNGNSIYSVITMDKTFSDISKHWAKADIELMANKLIVNGVTDTKFAPDNNITRAEFTALLVRALGLTSDAASATFTDVKASDWYAGSVGSAVKAKLVTGITASSFKPNDTITREQMAVMITRAISAAGKKATDPTASSDALAQFKDKASIDSWAKASIAQSVEAKIITGLPDQTFAPSAKASRAQAVVMLKRLLKYVDFIN
ncbi:S-layer homology domain-containing protein [Cohnella silvisoli]|uniref:S-layer homology domain-containing protein n=1 Tax=Cohnella silvisoli TaxID=2873699 RepID=A0ABV1L162_9BACL|nr:S-layer homology domain-containing protein [Cohnella silvisoli]MCD9025028.1 S-layer homology domain-containing protein [Cohnella silvisoli]